MLSQCNALREVSRVCLFMDDPQSHPYDVLRAFGRTRVRN